MKKRILLCALCLLLWTGCSSLEAPVDTKTVYNVGELATIDYYQVKLNDRTYNENKITLEFVITNQDKEAHTIDQDNFSLTSEDNRSIVPDNQVSMTLNPNQTKTITITYTLEDSMKEGIGILFYSGVVTNNIKFQIS